MTRNVSSTPRDAISAEIDRDLLKKLSRPAPWRLLLQAGFEWLCIFAAATSATCCPGIGIKLVCMLTIATRQRALLTLMHEFSHYQFSRKHQRINDFLGDVITALPFFITVHGFRRNHMAHHRHTASEYDPNWVASIKRARYQFPKTKCQIWLEILKHGIGFYTVAELKRYTVEAGMAIELPRAVRLTRLGFWSVVLALAVRFELGAQILLYWFVPMATFLMAILYVSDIGEHYGMRAPGILGSRTVLASPLERVLFAQNAVNFHAEHHLFPSVPFFRLRQLHQHLLQLSSFRQHAVITRGYLGGLIEEASAADGSGATRVQSASGVT